MGKTSTYNTLHHLNEVLKDLVHTVKLSTLKDNYKKLSSAYRQRKKTIILTYEDCLSYALARMPATLTVQQRIWKTFEKAIDLHKNNPLSILDIGAGPGTCIWALKDALWVKDITLIEKEKAFVRLGQHLMAALELSSPIHFNKQYIHANVINHKKTSADIVFGSYWLNEMVNISKAITLLWKAANHYVILIEPGTPQGFKNLLTARDYFLSQGGSILAPCPGNIACPMAQAERTWCHFRERLPRFKAHHFIKEASLSFEEEPYCYLIAHKNRTNSINPSKRIISSIKKTKTGLKTLVCGHEGLEEITITKKERNRYREVLKKQWGGIL